MTTTQSKFERGKKTSFNDWKPAGNTEPPEKDLGLDWDKIRADYQARLDWEEDNGLDPIERKVYPRVRISESKATQAQPVKPKPKKKAAPKAKKKPGPKPKAPVEKKKPGPKPKSVDPDRVLALHKEGKSNAAIARELGCSVQRISYIMVHDFGIRQDTRPGEYCKAGKHLMSEFGKQDYKTKPDGTKVKDGRHCTACRAEWSRINR
jgi:hypothetical protein